MPNKAYFTADVQDPVTGETKTFTADTPEELDALAEAHFAEPSAEQ